MVKTLKKYNFKTVQSEIILNEQELKIIGKDKSLSYFIGGLILLVGAILCYEKIFIFSVILSIKSLLYFFSSYQQLSCHSLFLLNLSNKSFLIRRKHFNKIIQYQGSSEALKFDFREMYNRKKQISGKKQYLPQIIFENNQYYVPFDLMYYGLAHKNDFFEQDIYNLIEELNVKMPFHQNIAA